MRNLKKLLALVVACVMVFGVVASAAVMQFPDVASTAKYAEAVKVLSALNIINGDDKGNFNPDKDVTRAEMAKILCALISKSASFGQTASGFADVTADHWASGYVKYAKGLNIINGYNETTFGPEDNVTYEQAIKLIVAALGYTWAAEDMGGYPAGYMLVAADLKITDKVTITDSTAPAKRSDIAMLAYNALEVKLMERTAYGTEAEYKPVEKTLLSNKLGVYRVSGYVKDTAKNNTAMDEGEIDYVLTNAENEAAAIKALGLVAGDDGAYALNDYFCQDAAAADLLYYTSNAYLAENEEGDYEVIAVVAKTVKTKEIVFEDLDVLCDEDNTIVEDDEVMNLDNGENSVFSYWTTADHDDKRPTVLDVAANAQMLVNGNEVAAGTLTETLQGVIAGTLKVIDTANDGEFDLFVIKSYDIAVVSSVTASSMTIRLNADAVNTTDVRTIVLNEDACENLKELTVTIDGAEATVADLAENDVLLIATNGDYKNFDPTFVEIIATRSVVEGKVRSEVNDDNLVEIGDAEYEVFPGLDFPDAGEEGKFFLTATGVIVYTDTAATIANNYAYVYKVGTSAFGDRSIRMLTAEGEDVTYDIADKMKINGESPVEGVYATAGAAILEDATATANDIVDAFTAEGGALNTDYLRLISYKVNGNEITELNVAIGSATEADDYGYAAEGDKEWVAATNKFKSSKYLAAGAKVFMIESGADFKDWRVVDAASLVNEKIYDVTFYGYNENNTYNVALITSGDMAADTTAALAYFVESRKTTYGEDDEVAYKVYFIQGGESKTMYVLEDDAALVDNGDGDFAEGDVFVYSVADDANLMENITLIASPSNVADVKDDIFAYVQEDEEDPEYYDAAADLKAFVEADILTTLGDKTDYFYTGDEIEADNELYFGIIATVGNADGGLKVKFTTDPTVSDSDDLFIIPETANVVVLNNKATKNKLYASTLDSIIASEYVAKKNGDMEIIVSVEDNEETEEDETVVGTEADTMFYYAFVRVYNDVVVDVYVINYENTMPKYTK